MHSRRGVDRLGILVAGVVVSLVMAGCTSDSDDPGADEPASSSTSDTPSAAASTGDEMDLDVLVYNIEYGGNASTDKVMSDLDADVVGVLESYNRLPDIAKRTGYPYYNIGLQLLSKYPIQEPSDAEGLYALIEVQPGYAIAFFNTHLDYVKYGPSLLARGVPVAEVIASEDEVRTSSITHFVPGLEATTAAGYPTFLTGDLNEPSSLDYTAAAVGSRPGVSEEVAWPVSERLFGVGMRDTYREINPDPVANPGLTWGDPKSDKPAGADRIDYVYAGGPVETVDSQIVGKNGDPDVDIGYPRWTSDHRAVLSTFRLAPMALPTTVSVDRRMLTEGDEVTIYYNNPGASETTVSVVAEDADVAQPAWSQTAPEAAGSMAFDTAGQEPGGYDVVMVDQGGDEVARNQIWIRSTKAEVELTTDASTYGVGDPIEVAWDDGPANRWDWIAVYRADADDPNKDDYLLWGYTGDHDSGALPPSVSGSMTMGASSQGRPWPLPPGDYVVHYLLTDQYESAGQTAFTVER